MPTLVLGNMQSDYIEKPFDWMRPPIGENYFNETTISNWKIKVTSLLKFWGIIIDDLEQKVGDRHWQKEIIVIVKDLWENEKGTTGTEDGHWVDRRHHPQEKIAQVRTRHEKGGERLAQARDATRSGGQAPSGPTREDGVGLWRQTCASCAYMRKTRKQGEMESSHQQTSVQLSRVWRKRKLKG